MPAVVAHLEVQVDDRDPHAPVERLGEQHLLARRRAVDEPLRDLDVGVPDQDRVDAGHLLGDQGGGVLRVGQRVAVRRAGVRSRVRGHHDHVAAGLLELGDEHLGLLDEAGEAELALDVGLVPDRDAGVGEAEDADGEGRSVLGGTELLDDVRREDRTPGRVVDGVRAEQRVVELRLEGAQDVEAVVELVVAERGRVVADRVHRRGHRVDGATGDRVDLGVVVGQRRALDGVAGVEGDDRLAGALLAHALDQGGRLGDADVARGRVGVLRVLEVVPVEDVAVQVGGAEHGQPGAVVAALVAAAGGVRDARDEPDGREGGGPGENGAACGQGGLVGHGGSREGDVVGDREVLSRSPGRRSSTSVRAAKTMQNVHQPHSPRTI